MRHSENDFVIPALKALYHLGGVAPTSEIKKEIPKYIELTNEDLIPFESRRTRKEERYRQVVGNMISHHNNYFFRYVIRDKNGNKSVPAGSLVLTEEGKKYVQMLEKSQAPSTTIGDSVEDKVYVSQNDNEKQVVQDVDNKIIKTAYKNGLEKRPAGDTRIREEILDICGRRCQYAMFIGEEHKTFIGRDGKPYVIAHHLIPMSARKDFFPRNLDRPSNIVCLCPMCHDQVHRGSKEEKAKILKVIYDHYIETLNDEQIYISFDELMNKYY